MTTRCKNWIDGRYLCPNEAVLPEEHCEECMARIGDYCFACPCPGCLTHNSMEPDTSIECDRKMGETALRCERCHWTVIVDSHGRQIRVVTVKENTDASK